MSAYPDLPNLMPVWEPEPCPHCRGTGRIEVGNQRPELLVCPPCEGTGTVLRGAWMRRDEWKAHRRLVVRS